MNQEKFGNVIKEIRKKHHLTQKQLAEKYNVTYQAVSKWENGKNMPDITLITQISKDFNISLEELFTGEYKPQKKKIIRRRQILLVSFFILLLLGVTIFFQGMQDNHFEFKTISSNCNDFSITGSIAYNDAKSSIFISNIDYQGREKIEKYTNIKCTLYEKNKDAIKIIDTCTYEGEEEITLTEFLKQVSFHVDGYSKICKIYEQDSLYLEIETNNNSKKIMCYKIPLKLENNCRE